MLKANMLIHTVLSDGRQSVENVKHALSYIRPASTDKLDELIHRAIYESLWLTTICVAAG